MGLCIGKSPPRDEAEIYIVMSAVQSSCICIAYAVGSPIWVSEGLDTGDGLHNDASCVVSVRSGAGRAVPLYHGKENPSEQFGGHYSRGTLVEWRPNKRGQYTVVTVVQSSCIA
jgi:hypothetical protein